ncbi:MAG: ABC transporter permease [Anaerolineae bacterium]|nr:ABC transporter permease [Anaerolineae bacterium]
MGQVSLWSTIRAFLAVANMERMRLVRYRNWVAGYVIWPVLFSFGYIFVAKALSGPDGAALDAFAAFAGTTDYVGYMVIGSTLWMWMNITLWDVGFFLRQEQLRGTLESNWLCPVPRIAIVAGVILIKAVMALFLLTVSAVEYRVFFGVRLFQGNPLLLLLIMVLTVPSVYGLGIAFASLVIQFKEANAMVFLVRGIFMIFCGISYPMAVLPGWMQRVAAFLPLTYAIEGVRRAALTQVTFVDMLPTLCVLAIFAVLLPTLGYGSFQLAERHARRTGSLGHY